MLLKRKLLKLYRELISQEITTMNEITEMDIRLEDLMSQKSQLIDQVRKLEGQLSRSLRDFEFDLAQRLFEQIIEVQKIVLVTDEINATLNTGVKRRLAIPICCPG